MSVTGQILDVHEKVYKATDGRIGHKVLGVPCLMLRTKGRRSGQTRTNGLVYAQDGDDYVVVASKGGDPKHPGWFHNLKANPEVERPDRPPTAERAGADRRELRPRLRPALEARQREQRRPLHAYQEKTDRPIPVVVITPA